MIPVLDKGKVTILSSSLKGSEFDQLLVRISRNRVNDRILSIPNLTLEIRCPLFVQLFLNEQGVQTYNTKTETNIETYIPTIPEIGTSDLKTNEGVAAHMTQVAEALLLNIDMYQKDGCDRFIAQVNTPVSVYNTVVAWGTLKQWIDLILLKSLPAPIEAYREAIYAALLVEWPNLPNYLKQIKK
jgi:hypothetical protein